MAEKQSFAINTEPHEATIGDLVLLFEPEVYSDDFLDAWATFRAAAAAAADDQAGDTAEAIRARTKAVNQAGLAFVASLMVPESAEAFLAARFPDRVIIELQRWILGVYGLRPTGASSESSAPSPDLSPGDDSTTGGPPAE